MLCVTVPAWSKKNRIDYRRPSSVCLAYLTAWKAKDQNAMAEAKHPKYREELRNLGPGGSRYDSIFSESSWRMKALRKWDGLRLGEIRAEGDEARCRFVQIDEIWAASAMLFREDGKWYAEDINRFAPWDPWGKVIKQ